MRTIANVLLAALVASAVIAHADNASAMQGWMKKAFADKACPKGKLSKGR